MQVITLLLMLSVAAADAETGSLPAPTGIVQGVVVDGTKDGDPLAGVEVILRAGVGGALVPVTQTKTDRYGKFAFKQVPLDSAIVYLPGANRQGVHYPAQRVHLDENNRVAYAKIVTYAAVATPSPLVADRHEIDVEVQQQALKVTETLLLSNPTRTTYVGRPMMGGQPVTFWLSIPENFDKVTFDKEFFGRRFIVIEHRPVTDLPWLPGKRQMRFTYHVPLAESAGIFRRPLDAPSQDVRVCVQGRSEGQVACNLPRVLKGDQGVTFASASQRLPESFTLELQIDALPFPWMQYARWGALFLLVGLAVATLAAGRFRGVRSKAVPATSRQRDISRRAA